MLRRERRAHMQLRTLVMHLSKSNAEVIGDKQERGHAATCAFALRRSGSSPDPCHLSPPPAATRRRVVVGEVEPGVEAEFGAGPAVVGARGFELDIETADADHLAVEANGCLPEPQCFIV